MKHIFLSVVQIYAEADGRSSQVDGFSVDVGQADAQVAKRDGALEVDKMVLVSVAVHDSTDAAVADDFCDYVVAQRCDGVGGVGELRAS